MNDKKGSKTRRHKSYLKRHYKLVAAAGGIIISLTLATKDKLQEQSRDFTSSVETTQNFLRIEQLGKNEMREIRLVDRSVGLVLSRQNGTQGGSTFAHNAFSDPTIDQDLEDIRESLMREGQLLSLVHDGGTLSEKLKVANDTHDRIEKMTRVGARTPDKPPIAANDRGEDWQRVMGNIYALQRDSETLSSETLAELEREKEFYIRRYALVSAISYALIALGFTLSLTGHVAGGDGELPEIKF